LWQFFRIWKVGKLAAEEIFWRKNAGKEAAFFGQTDIAGRGDDPLVQSLNQDDFFRPARQLPAAFESA
jgi:hypothetical protein